MISLHSPRQPKKLKSRKNLGRPTSPSAESETKSSLLLTPSSADPAASSNASSRTLSTISVNAMNGSRKPTATTENNINSKPVSHSNREPSPDSRSIVKPTAMPHAALSSRPNGATPIAQSFLSDQNPLPRSITAPSLRLVQPENAPNGQGSNPNGEESIESPPGGSIPVGGASLGKSGRVIERLMHENDMLKRDLQIERLRSEEARKDVSMAQGKVVQMQSEYDARLHEASVNKTLLKRRERQLADAKAQIEGERQKTEAAMERERTWRTAMEASEKESKHIVEKATAHAAMMDGRNSVLTNHWKDQGALVDASVKKLGAEIATIGEQRRQDLDRMNSLQDICDQQSAMLDKLGGEKETIMAAFEAYKAAQDQLLQGIKTKAEEQERANEAAIREAQEVVGQLKWALNVKKNVTGAGEA